MNGAEFTGSPENDIRVIGFAVVLILLAIALIGLDWEAKVRHSLFRVCNVASGLTLASNALSLFIYAVVENSL